MSRKSFLLLLFVSLYFACYSQREDYVWRLGYFSGIDFNVGIPDTFSINKNTPLLETNASICDSSGSLLFFTNGAAIFNRNSDTLFNGDHLNPGVLTNIYAPDGIPIPQADIIIQRPLNPNQYYLFHETWNETINSYPFLISTVLYLTIVDVSLDNGLGGVTGIKNYHLYENDTLLSGKLSAIKHANGRDWWLITKKLTSPIFYKWLITPDSIIGPYIQANQPASGSFADEPAGQSCFSPDGSKYAAIYNNKYFYLYDFNRCSGDLNFIYSTYLNDSSNWGNGCAFSSSGQYLYISTQFYVYQYDLFAANFSASKTTVAIYDGFASPQIPFYTRFNLMRLAPDGKIYISTDNGCDVLHVIESPDSAGVSCNVQQHSFYLSPSLGAVVSVPNIPDYKLGTLTGSGCDTILSVPKNQKSIFSFSAYPNPTSGNFTLNFYFNKNLVYNLFVKDISGRLLLKTDGIAVKGINLKEMNLTGLANGIYFVNLSSSEINETIRVTIE